MKIAFCTPFKPVNHPSISGDVTIARDLFQTLKSFGHELIPVEFFSAKKIYWKPGQWPGAGMAARKMIEQAQGADCWLTYGSYYKVPDVFGPLATSQLQLPYFIFQASYATNRAKKIATWPGFMLNRRAMLMANHIFCNRMNDVKGCRKLLSEKHFSYVKPGLPDNLFGRDEAARIRLRSEWQVGETPVVITTAMMRHGVKAEGLRWVIESCADLNVMGKKFKLIVAGDGPRRQEIEAMAKDRLGDKVSFLGMVDRADLAGVFSAGDLFAFPGLEESVGMVYLEAQQCGLPAVATDDEGAPHVIKDNYSGLVTSVSKTEFTNSMARLIADSELRMTLGKQAIEYVSRHHSAATNYHAMAEAMERMVRQRKEQ